VDRDNRCLVNSSLAGNTWRIRTQAKHFTQMNAQIQAKHADSDRLNILPATTLNEQRVLPGSVPHPR
jgi:hypothetical protein